MLTVYHSRDVGAPGWSPQCWHAYLELDQPNAEGISGAFGQGETREEAVAVAHRLLGLQPPAAPGDPS